jgi:hypothetical protein
MTIVPLKLCQEIGLWCDPSLMIMRRLVLRHRVAWYLDMRRHSKRPAAAPGD